MFEPEASKFEPEASKFEPEASKQVVLDELITLAILADCQMVAVTEAMSALETTLSGMEQLSGRRTKKDDVRLLLKERPYHKVLRHVLYPRAVSLLTIESN